MDKKTLEHLVLKSSDDLLHVIRGVSERGFSDSHLEADEYDELLGRKEFRDLVIGELYEAYFLPERHEFDWQIVHEIVSILTSARMKEFIATSVVGGVLGNSAFVALRATIDRVISIMKEVGLHRDRQKPFHAMKRDVRDLEIFFDAHNCARVAEIEASTKVPREKVSPLLKLLGFQHHRRTYNCQWCRPGSMPENVR